MRRVWPWRLAAREGVETARAGRWTSLLVVVGVAWACAAPGAADAVGVTHLIESERAWIDGGGHVFVVTGAREDGQTNPIPGPACDRLDGVDGILAAFALTRTNATASLTYIPGGRAGVYAVTPGAAHFLHATAFDEPTVLITAGFVRRTGVADGEVVRIQQRAGFSSDAATSDPLRVAVVDSQILGEEFDGALLVPSPPQATADACYVLTDAAHYVAVESALGSWLAYDGKPAIANTRLFTGEFTVDYTHAYEQRPLRWIWVPTAAILGLLWGMIQWFRRGQIAIYATFGARPHARLVMQAAEWGVLGAVGAVWGWSLGIVAAVAGGARAEQALALVSFHSALTLLGASLVVVVLGLRPTGTLLNALKDR